MEPRRETSWSLWIYSSLQRGNVLGPWGKKVRVCVFVYERTDRWWGNDWELKTRLDTSPSLCIVSSKVAKAGLFCNQIPFGGIQQASFSRTAASASPALAVGNREHRPTRSNISSFAPLRQKCRGQESAGEELQGEQSGRGTRHWRFLCARGETSRSCWSRWEACALGRGRKGEAGAGVIAEEGESQGGDGSSVGDLPSSPRGAAARAVEAAGEHFGVAGSRRALRTQRRLSFAGAQSRSPVIGREPTQASDGRGRFLVLVLNVFFVSQGTREGLKCRVACYPPPSQFVALTGCNASRGVSRWWQNLSCVER